MRIVIASGYFNPLHAGHIEYLNMASLFGDVLFVIVNTDEQVKLKGSVPFMNEKERAKIVDNIKSVNKVFLSSDKDGTVCETLKIIHKAFEGNEIIFAKGGDRVAKNVPEYKLCKQLGIKFIDGLGKKIRSSSELIKKASEG